MAQQQNNGSFSGVIGRTLLLPFRAVAYVLNPLNWCNSKGEIRRDAEIALKKVKDGRPRKMIHVKMLRDSLELGMRLLDTGVGYVVFSIPERIAGKVKKVKEKKIDSLLKEHSNIMFSKRNKIAIIEIDIEHIDKNSNHSEKVVVDLVAKQIRLDLKALMKATGGERLPYHDMKLIYSTAKALYDSYRYFESEEKEMSVEPDRSLIVCIANKGIMSLGYKTEKENNTSRIKESASKPGSSMSCVMSEPLQNKNKAIA